MNRTEIANADPTRPNKNPLLNPLKVEKELKNVFSDTNKTPNIEKTIIISKYQFSWHPWLPKVHELQVEYQ